MYLRWFIAGLYLTQIYQKHADILFYTKISVKILLNSELILNYIDLLSNFILYSHESIHDKLTWGIQNSTANKCLQTVHTDLLKEEDFSRNVNLGSFIEHYCAILNNACMTNLIGISKLCKAPSGLVLYTIYCESFKTLW